MSIATPSIDALRDTLSDELKDIRLNLSSVLVGETLVKSDENRIKIIGSSCSDLSLGGVGPIGCLE